MKQVVQSVPPTNVVLINQVSIDKYYGVQINRNDRGFVTRKEFGNEEPFVLRSACHITKGNGWTNAWMNNITDLSRFLTVLAERWDNCDIFEFDSSKELLNWVLAA